MFFEIPGYFCSGNVIFPALTSQFSDRNLANRTKDFFFIINCYSELVNLNLLDEIACKNTWINNIMMHYTLYNHTVIYYTLSNSIIVGENVPARNYNRNTRTMCEICSKLIKKTPERRHWCMKMFKYP